MGISIFPVTNGRRTVVRLDAPDRVLLQHAFAAGRSGQDIGAGPRSEKVRVRFVPGSGWELEPLQLRTGDQQETTNGGSGVLDIQVPAGIQQVNAWRKPTELTGVSYLAKVSSAGDPMYQKAVGASESWADTKFDNSADRTALPGPDASNDSAQMSRVGVGRGLHDPNTTLYARLFVPGSPLRTPHATNSFSFSGPPSGAGGYVGLGYYSIKLGADGVAQLWERQQPYDSTGALTGSPDWRIVATFRFSEASRVVGAMHLIEIRPRRYGQLRDRATGSILIRVAEASSANAVAGGSIARAFNALPQTGIFHYVANLPDSFPVDAYVPPAAQPVRVDERIDLRTQWQVSEARYPATGWITDDPIAVPVLFPATGAFRAFWVGQCPSGTSIDVELYAFKEDGSYEGPISSTGNVAGSQWGQRTYTPSPSWRYVVMRAKLSTTAPSATPVLEAMRVVCDPYYGDRSQSPVETSVNEVDITGQEKDPGQARASIQIKDETDSLPGLRTRLGSCVEVATEWVSSSGITPDWTDPANAPYRAVLHRGYTSQVASVKRGKSLRPAGSNSDVVYPSPNWRNYQVEIGGVWERFQEALAPFTYDFMFGEAGGESLVPMKATDALRVLIGWVFPPEMNAIDDLPIRLFAKLGEDSGSVISAGASISDFALRMAADYLGRGLVFDEGASPSTDPTRWYGCWRLSKSPYAPFNNLVHFRTRPVARGGVGTAIKAYHDLAAWGFETGSGDQPIKVAPVFSLRDWVKKIEANVVTVMSTGLDGANGSVLTAATAYNVNSYNFYPGKTTEDPSDPDWVGYPIEAKYVDPNVPARLAPWVARRILNASRAQVGVVIEAPNVLVTDITDPIQRRPRKLMYGDPVLVDGVQHIVRSCSTRYRKDEVQLASYELVKWRAPL